MRTLRCVARTDKRSPGPIFHRAGVGICQVSAKCARPAADAGDYDALVLPGGVMNPDRQRMDDKAIGFVRCWFDAKKPVAAICHGLWTPVAAAA